MTAMLIRVEYTKGDEEGDDDHAYAITCFPGDASKWDDVFKAISLVMTMVEITPMDIVGINTWDWPLAIPPIVWDLEKDIPTPVTDTNTSTSKH